MCWCAMTPPASGDDFDSMSERMTRGEWPHFPSTLRKASIHNSRLTNHAPTATLRIPA